MLLDHINQTGLPRISMSQYQGKTLRHDHEILGNIGKHFNNPEISDVTLSVGETSYHLHRFVLAAQSSVFHAMLMNGVWKESKEKIVPLEESPECEQLFGEFLEYFYTGVLTLNLNNVRTFHILADKYDVPLLRDDALALMREVLTGVQGGAYSVAPIWLPYIEQFIPGLLPACYESIQTNFYYFIIPGNGCIHWELKSHHVKEILTRQNNHLVVYSEYDIFAFVTAWAKSKFNNLSKPKAKTILKEILPLIRFSNMDDDQLMAIEESDLCKALGKSFIADYISPAYKVHSQMGTMVRKDCRMCPWDSADNCQHMNPRLYLMKPYGIFSNTPSNSSVGVKPVDLGDIRAYARLRTVGDDRSKGNWSVEWKGNYEPTTDQINETFTITPASGDSGRSFTIILSLIGCKKSQGLSSTCLHHMHTIKRTGIVTKQSKRPEPITYHSPIHTKGSWNTGADSTCRNLLSIAIHLHRQAATV